MSKKSTTKTRPWNAQAINSAQNTLQNTVAGNQGQLDANAGLVNSTLPGLASRVNNPHSLTTAAQGYASNVLGGQYLNGNPHLDAIASQTRGNVSDQVNSVFSRAGRTAGDQHGQILTRELADAENRLRFGDYDSERNRMGQAAALTPGLVASEFAPVEAMLSAAQVGSEIPYLGARTLAQGTSQLQSPYSTSTQKQGLGSTLANLAGFGMMAFGGGGPLASLNPFARTGG